MKNHHKPKISEDKHHFCDCNQWVVGKRCEREKNEKKHDQQLERKKWIKEKQKLIPNGEQKDQYVRATIIQMVLNKGGMAKEFPNSQQGEKTVHTRLTKTGTGNIMKWLTK